MLKTKHSYCALVAFVLRLLSLGGGLPAAAALAPLENEPAYCICHKPSSGQMVGCDNPECAIEWFHYECVGLKADPVGKWYCPVCRGEQKLTKRAKKG